MYVTRQQLLHTQGRLRRSAIASVPVCNNWAGGEIISIQCAASRRGLALGRQPVKRCISKSASLVFSGSSQLNRQQSFRHSTVMAEETKKKWKIYSTRPLLPFVFELLNEKCDIEQRDQNGNVDLEDLCRGVAGKDGLYCSSLDKPIAREVLDAAGPNLKVVSTSSAGFEHVDLQQLKERNIRLGHTPGVLTDATAELAVTLLLCTSRRLMESWQYIKSNTKIDWSPLWMCGRGLTGSIVGIIGFGRIGQAVGQQLKPFGVRRILYCGHNPKEGANILSAEFVPQDELLQQSDFIIVCCNLTQETRGMINREAFQKMKKTATFVNISRGAVVNQDDLVEALQSGSIGAAGLDVTTPEPLPLDHPLLNMTNCVVLPHVGSATIETREAMLELSAKNLLAGLEGKPMPAEVPL